jgi:hypothetical protein
MQRRHRWTDSPRVEQLRLPAVSGSAPQRLDRNTKEFCRLSISSIVHYHTPSVNLEFGSVLMLVKLIFLAARAGGSIKRRIQSRSATRLNDCIKT